MSWRKEQRRNERGYHHGNLKEALLQAALGLIAEKGAAGFTFADAARMAGVSPAAPYRHFRDRDELLSSIAQRGFEQFEALLTQAWDDGRPDTVTAFERVGKAYLAFARNEPAFYSAMFESGLPVDANPTLMAASERALPIINRLVKVDLRERYLEVPHQTAITKDNAPVDIDFLIYYKVVDASASIIQVQNFTGASVGLATTTLRAVVGDIPLDELLSKREQINSILRTRLDEVTERWGIKVTNVEIREIRPPKDVQDAMVKQMTAERSRRALVTESDGIRES